MKCYCSSHRTSVADKRIDNLIETAPLHGPTLDRIIGLGISTVHSMDHNCNPLSPSPSMSVHNRRRLDGTSQQSIQALRVQYAYAVLDVLLQDIQRIELHYPVSQLGMSGVCQAKPALLCNAEIDIPASTLQEA
ncbi:MAG: hypothetical protein KAQ74_01325, partial [Dehalococcoidia bacterium]|nr:hypothetical protein [Dehalococcoidia bacterium]